MQGINERDNSKSINRQLNQLNDIKILVHPEIITEDDLDSTVNLISRIYEEHNINLAELLTSIEVQGLSLEDIVKIYSTLYEQIEGSEVVIVDCERNMSIPQ